MLRSLPLLVELLRYGRQHSEVTILEGILPAGDYRPLFEAAREAYGTDIFAYYYDLPFEETLARHRTKPNRNDFGEEEMRRWWREKDLLPCSGRSCSQKRWAWRRRWRPSTAR